MMRYFLCMIITWLSVSLAGCATQSAVQFFDRYDPARHHRARIERCVDRTGFSGQRDLATDATTSLRDKVKELGTFEMSEDGQLVLTCEIERFVEGSALKRWLAPGWGRTQAQVVVMIFERPGDKVLATLRSQAEVAAGGLYTIGADSYIMGAAFDDIVRQLRDWANGRNPAE